MTESESGQWQRVLIVGGPGSGKTTLGKRLANLIGCDLTELDAVAYERGAGAERSLDDRLRDVATIAGHERWVAEGSYIGWTDALALAADVIVLLDPPWRVARQRIVLRHAKASLRRTNKHPGLRKLWRFLGDCQRYYVSPDGGRTRTAHWLEAYAGKMVTCRTNGDLHRLVARFHRPEEGA